MLEALDIHREVGNRRFEGLVLVAHGGLLATLERLEEAEKECRSGLQIARDVGNEGAALGSLAEVLRDGGREEEAGRVFLESIAILQEARYRRMEGVMRCEFARLRDPFPKTVHLAVDTSRGETATQFPANTFRWIRIEETGEAKSRHAFEDAGKGLLKAGHPRIEATRDGNRISVKTSVVTKYTVLLSPDMVDFSKPVTIETNGALSFEGAVAADARTVLEEARRFRDAKLLFHARVTVEVDAPGK